MKVSFCAAATAGLLTVSFSAHPHNAKGDPITALDRIGMFDAEDFAFSLGGPEPDNLVDGFQLRAVTVSQLPALEGQGIAMGVVNLGPCAIGLPHIPPRAAEVAISRRVSRFKLQLRDRQEARRSRGGGDDRPTPMAWGWSLDAA